MTGPRQRRDAPVRAAVTLSRSAPIVPQDATAERLPRMSMPPSSPAAARISCIICALNEGPRIGAVLDVAATHPLVAEVIVVDDGSTDHTPAAGARYPAGGLGS